MQNLISFLQTVINLYVWVVIISVILSWLMTFGVINMYNPLVRSIWQGVNALTEPFLAPIRRFMPNLGGLDISPVILWLACIFVRDVILENLRYAFV